LKVDGDGDWSLQLKNPNAHGIFAGRKSLDLSVAPSEPCRSHVSSEESARAKRREIMISDIKSGNVSKYLADFDVEKMRLLASQNGAENDDLVKQYIDTVEKAKNTDYGNLSSKDSEKLACTFMKSVLKFGPLTEDEGGDENGQTNKTSLLRNDAFNVSGLLKFFDAFGMANNIMDEQEFERCLTM
jgi:hypothetical protein